MARRHVLMVKAEPATLVRLSASTSAVISKRGTTLIRGREAFTLADTETRNLQTALHLAEQPVNDQGGT